MNFQVIAICLLVVFTVNAVKCDKDPMDCQIIVDRGKGLTICIFSQVNSTDKDVTKINVTTSMFQGRLIESEQVTAILMAFSNFDTIPSNVFNNFGNIYNFKAYGGSLKFINKESFIHASHLRHFELSDTKIGEISANAFEGAENLSEIVLDNCVIGKIFDNAFVGLDNLKILRLRGTNYTDMEFLDNLPASVELIDTSPEP